MLKYSWINTGNVDLSISGVTGLTSDANAVLRSYGLSQSTLTGGTYGEGGFISSTDELTLTADITITGDAGSVVDLGKSIFEVTATGIDETFLNSKGTKNLITYQGDLNYDGRVSMKDLAYLNAGAARVNSGGDVAGDVDANYDDSIDLLDLAVLDKDWGKTLHSGADDFWDLMICPGKNLIVRAIRPGIMQYLKSRMHLRHLTDLSVLLNHRQAM